ncbi:flagellar hook-basal body complex protein FliE [Chromobacterium violaceum]|uniref:Flagellar hook-basal body complex protein FliE n=1 Tax=Chromobacterium violaceum TaxID=536 RepID=A0A1R0MQK3_CHRVL|nr:flagellar hook-basal body complex protein FliE [Chromobacterium violaceum]ATP29356.1 flagellar hook-basal body protein [Chromobacterium violaceum]ATP33263.1 flagellar hook-basal body protein [Chromobacterium violaceum]KMN47850.1 flagellar hook-basal body protein [Chromobacterium violaceum]KMN86654.1 flagellar hook-basal body protein [Chromobacterium violaceum]KMN92145.1 flagellar hook-basal body protein [Chromobacterium violaceum]
MATNLGLMIHADRSQLLGEMAKLGQSAPAPIAAQEDAAAGHSFSQAMVSAVRDVDQQNRLAAEKMTEVDSGQSDDLVGAMLMSQEASLSFSMLMQVRNKVVGAVDDLIKMQL